VAQNGTSFGSIFEDFECHLAVLGSNTFAGLLG
jgi:hypothetical protein